MRRSIVSGWHKKLIDWLVTFIHFNSMILIRIMVDVINCGKERDQLAALISFILLCSALVASPLLIAIGGAFLIRKDELDKRFIITINKD